MNAITLLVNQHREVRKLFESIESGNGDLQDLVGKLADALVAHTTIEHQLFYPAAKEIDPDLVLESFEEHATVEMELKRLLVTDVADPSFKAKVVVLKELVMHHVKEEEEKLFPEVQKALGSAKLDRLGLEMKTLFDEVVQEGHEATLPHTAPTTIADEARIRTWGATDTGKKKATKPSAGRASAPSMA